MLAKVSLLSYTPQPEKIIASAAKLCYSPSGINSLMDSLSENSISSFLEMLTEIGHESPIEHVAFTFGIEDVSRSLLAQITRHRIASFSVQSQRYVKETTLRFVTPPEIESDPNAKEIYLKSMGDSHQNYLKLADILEKKYFDQFLSQGLANSEARRISEKRAIEDARFVLPNACDTKMVVTMNARSLNHFFKMRCCNRAQWEIQDVATKMLMLVREVAPVLFAHSGPPCLSGFCPEGKMSCGKIKEVKEKFSVNH